jgi:hypothetical protein
MCTKACGLARMHERQGLVLLPGDGCLVPVVVVVVGVPEVQKQRASVVELREPVPDELVAKKHKKLRARLFELSQDFLPSAVVCEVLRCWRQVDRWESQLRRARRVLPVERLLRAGFRQVCGTRSQSPRGGARNRAARESTGRARDLTGRAVHVRVGGLEPTRARRHLDALEDVVHTAPVPEHDGLGSDGESANEELAALVEPTGVHRGRVDTQDKHALRRSVFLRERTERLTEGIRSREDRLCFGHDECCSTLPGVGEACGEPLLERGMVQPGGAKDRLEGNLFDRLKPVLLRELHGVRKALESIRRVNEFKVERGEFGPGERD